MIHMPAGYLEIDSAGLSAGDLNLLCQGPYRATGFVSTSGDCIEPETILQPYGQVGSSWRQQKVDGDHL